MASYKFTANIKRVKVDFDSAVESKHFNPNTYNRVKTNGIFLTDLSLVHYASIHFQSRFENSFPRRFRHTFDTIEPSIVKNKRAFCFDDCEEAELQKSSSEVIGVGFSSHLMHDLFDVNVNRINRIPNMGKKKRCDYEILKNSVKYIYESKGRKGSINRAKKEIINQKSSYPDCIKYGIISHIPRDGVTPVEIYVVDPNIRLPKFNKNDEVVTLLRHYSRCARLAGFYRLSEKLNERIRKILASNIGIEEFNKKELDYQNVIKHGYGRTFRYFGDQFEFFHAPNMDIGFKYESEKGYCVFSMEKNILEILDEQDYDKLLNYRFDNIFSDRFSLLDNGTLLLNFSCSKYRELSFNYL